VEFVVTAISSGSSGVEKWSAAQKALAANNVQLAAAYQSLASQNALVAVAKVVQAQMDLFTGCIDALVLEANQLRLAMAAVRSGFQSFGNSLQTVPDQTSATQMTALAQGANSLWSAFGSELAGIRQSMLGVGPGGLPRV
jgi:hypothetical protein